MVLFTLKRMLQGGINDHVEGGSHRYSTDGRWHVPHFEKMLYDNAQLAVTFASAVQLSANTAGFADMRPQFERTLRRLLAYVDASLSHASGGFMSAEDADSLPTATATEKREGAFCVWTMDEIRQLLGGTKVTDGVSLADVFINYYNMKPSGNCDARMDPHGELRGQNVPIVYESVESTANDLNVTEAECASAIDAALDVLKAYRHTHRPRAHLDTKMITAWNALMISGLCAAARALACDEYVARAVKCAQFVERYLVADDGDLLRCAYADDRNDEQVRQM